MNRKLLIWLPLAGALLLMVMFYAGLKNPSDHVIASKMVGQPLPEFAATAAIPSKPGTASAEYRDGKPRLLNVFASWCVPCVAEIPMLLQLQAKGVEINGVAVHDTTPDLEKFLVENGNPYTKIGLDQGGKAQMAFGSAGVPETFVVDGQGKIVHQHIGVVTENDIPNILAILERAK